MKVHTRIKLKNIPLVHSQNGCEGSHKSLDTTLDCSQHGRALTSRSKQRIRSWSGLLVIGTILIQIVIRTILYPKLLRTDSHEDYLDANCHQDNSLDPFCHQDNFASCSESSPRPASLLTRVAIYWLSWPRSGRALRG